MGWLYCLTFANGKKYIGLTTTSPSRRFGRHKAASQDLRYRARVYVAWRKHGEPKFSILAQLPDGLLAEMERKAIAVLNTRIPHGYNQSEGGEGAFGVAVSEETRRKISESQKGKVMSEASRQRMAEAKRGRKLSEAHKAKIAAAHLGKPKAPEAIEKTRAANIGKRHSEETKAKISANRKGIPRSPKASAQAAKKHRGRKNSPETIEKMRLAALRRYGRIL